MKLALVVLALLLFAGCPDRAQLDSELPLTRALLDLAAQAERELSLESSSRQGTLRRLEQLVTHAKRKARPAGQGVEAIEALNRLLFETYRYRREVNDRSPGLMLLPRVLEQRRGSCVGLAGLYLVLGEQLGLPLHGVLVPGHLFVRYEAGGQRRDVELLKRGDAMPRAWYARKYGLPEDNTLYGRSLSGQETLAVFRFNLANEQRLRGAYRRAIALYEQVVRQLPEFAEAHANLGLSYQLVGDAERARAAYARASGANPALGRKLRRNLRALKTGRRP